MKKLLIALTAIASFAGISFGAGVKDGGFISGTSFELLTPGDPLNTTFADDGQTPGANYWNYDQTKDSPATVSNDVITVASRPMEWDGTDVDQDGKSKFLSVDTSDLLQRNIDVVDGAAQDIGSGIYVDTVVQFTASDATTIDTDAEADKLVVWMQTVDHDAEGDIEAYTETNLIVTAGSYASGSLAATDYIVSVDGIEVLPGEWHRLTIKSMKIGSGLTGSAAFVVFIDGKEATYASTMANPFTGMTLDATAASWNDKRALFPSLLGAGKTESQMITSLGVEGSGFIDDISFTTTAPSFASDGTYFTLNWDSAAFTSLSVNDAAVTLADKTATFEVSATENEFTITYELASGYSMLAPTCNGGVAYNNDKFTVTGTGSATLVTKQAVYEVAGVAYDTFAAALTAAAKNSTASTPGVIKMLSNATTVKVGKESEAYIVEDQFVVLDLAGKTLTGGVATSPTVAVDEFGYLHIIDSSTEKTGRIVPYSEDDSAVAAYGGELEIDAGIFDGLVEIDGSEKVTTVLGGSYLAEYNSDRKGAFELADYVAEGYEAKLVGDYWVVARAGDQPTYAITWETLENGTADKAADSYETGTTITFTANTGYLIDTVTVNGKPQTIEAGATTYVFTVGAEAAALVVTFKPVPVIENVKITITPNEKTSYAITSGEDPVEVKDNEAIVEKGSVYDVTATVTAEGYEFTATDGWALKDGKLTLSVDYAVEATIVIPAPTAIAYTITYMEGEVAAVFAKDATVATTYTIEAAVTLPTADDFETRDGATFAGWFENAAFTGDPITTIAKGSTGAKTFYAKWDEVAPGGDWDIPGTEGGINAIVGEGGAKYVEFSSIAFTATGATVGLKAGKIDANGQIFGLVCKTDLTSKDTFVINATLTAEEEATEGLFTITADLSGYTQLFVIGVGPAKQN